MKALPSVGIPGRSDGGINYRVASRRVSGQATGLKLIKIFSFLTWSLAITRAPFRTVSYTRACILYLYVICDKSIEFVWTIFCKTAFINKQSKTPYNSESAPILTPSSRCSRMRRTPFRIANTHGLMSTWTKLFGSSGPAPARVNHLYKSTRKCTRNSLVLQL